MDFTLESTIFAYRHQDAGPAAPAEAAIFAYRHQEAGPAAPAEAAIFIRIFIQTREYINV